MQKENLEVNEIRDAYVDLFIRVPLDYRVKYIHSHEVVMAAFDELAHLRALVASMKLIIQAE